MHKTTRLPWIATSLCLGLLLAGCGPQQQKNAAQNTDSPPIAATNTAGSTGDTPATAGTPAENSSCGTTNARQRPRRTRLYRLGRLPMVAECRKSASGFSKRAPGWVSATDPNATLAAYLVFGKDSLQSELFLPLQPGILPAEPPENFRRPPMERRQRRHAHGGTGRRKMER